MRSVTSSTVPTTGPKVDDIADAVLILGDEKDAGQVVLDGLRTQNQGPPMTPALAKQRRDVDVELSKNRQDPGGPL